MLDIQGTIGLSNQGAHDGVHGLVGVRLTSLGPSLVWGRYGFLERGSPIRRPYRGSAMTGRTAMGEVGADLGSHLLARRTESTRNVWIGLILLTDRQQCVWEARLDPSAPLIDIRHDAGLMVVCLCGIRGQKIKKMRFRGVECCDECAMLM